MDNQTIKCPYCNKEFPLTETISKQLREEISKEFEEKIKKKDIDITERENDFRETIKIAYAGFLNENKGVEYLIKAGNILKSSEIESEINIIGDGPDRNRLEEIAKELEVKVDFHGFVWFECLIVFCVFFFLWFCMVICSFFCFSFPASDDC